MIKKLDDGRYKLDFYPAGAAGRRVQIIRDTRKELKVLQAEYEAAVNTSPLNFASDKRSLSDLVQLWFKLHGVTLRDSKYRLSRTGNCHF